MFTKNTAFLKLATRRPPPRRKSEVHRAVHTVYANPPQLFPSGNKLLNRLIARLYWALRALQFRLFFRNEEMDSSSLDELNRFEPPERPPNLEQLLQLTGHRFSQGWVKYMYNRFKNECPTGRMRFAEFKRLFGGFIPDRLNDGYLERMFFAFCQSSTYPDQLTFKDLLISLSHLCDQSPASVADWVMRLIDRDRDQVGYQMFLEFVKSVFTLRGRGEMNERKRRAGSILLGGSPISGGDEQRRSPRPPTVRSVALLASAITAPTAAPAIANFGGGKQGSSSLDRETLRAVGRRASVIFNELDTELKGYLTSEDFERFFRAKYNLSIVFVS